ncbi:MAG TPA: SusF/SusE family outer membrane protein, partial [Mucilaginibacter sp.]|nr:SusF/SusE family outer membrane protein [Mucilaginibacter sp.]
ITSDLVVFDSNKNTLTLTPTLWSVVGDASPGGWPASSGYQSDTDMKFDNGTQTWSVVVNLTAGGNIKFRLNHDWGTNLGGSNGTLSLNGDNIPIATSGKYLVTLDPVALTYTVTPD